MTQRQLRRANQQQQQHVDSTAIIVFFFKAAARPEMCAPSVAPIAHRLHCQISIIIQAAVLYIAHFAQQGRSWNRYRMFLTDCDAADRKTDKHNSRLTGCHHVVRCQLCQAACAPFFSVDLLTNHKSRHRCPDGRPQERMSASEWRVVISHRRRPSLFFWKTGKQIIHHREYTGGCDGTTRSRSPCLLLMMSKDTRAWISGQRRRRRGE